MNVDKNDKIKNIKIIDKSWFVYLKLNDKYKKFLIEKGSIAVNGVSLTISKLLKDGFQITIIPHTLKLTNLITIKKGDLVNIELDFFSKYLSKLKLQ